VGCALSFAVKRLETDGAKDVVVAGLADEVRRLIFALKMRLNSNVEGKSKRVQEMETREGIQKTRKKR
jgi:hypothetical protein